MGTEVELKYAAPNAAALEHVLDALRSTPPRGVKLLGEVKTIQMQTRYFDTVDGSLSSRQWMLRLRRENSRTVACLKLPGQIRNGLAVRDEWECEAENLQDAAALLVAQGAPVALKELVTRGLRELCGATFLRQAAVLQMADGSEAELALDVGELTGGAVRMPIYEMELELLRGSPEEAQKLAQALAREFGLEAAHKSKFARAKALAQKITL